MTQSSTDMLVVDFTSNQEVYDTHKLPKSLLRWRILVGKSVQLFLPTFCEGDTWKIAAIKEVDEGLFSPASDSNVLEVADGDVRALDPEPVAAKGGMEYPGLAFTLSGRMVGTAIVELVQSNSLRSFSTTRYKLELTVSS
ncbi:MAG: hypothetical protein P4L53_18740 [Candidatus Obscuribacterales bacterium]|nr:hypothetical protein [Candidatus Obscuribacterales bacterium]